MSRWTPLVAARRPAYTMTSSGAGVSPATGATKLCLTNSRAEGKPSTATISRWEAEMNTYAETRLRHARRWATSDAATGTVAATEFR